MKFHSDTAEPLQKNQNLILGMKECKMRRYGP